VVRGRRSDIDFATFEKFKAYADPNRDDRIRAHVIDRGNMPLAKIVFDAFYAAKRDETLATFLESQGFSVRDASGAVLKPGRPVADPGPDRVVRQGATRLFCEGKPVLHCVCLVAGLGAERGDARRWEHSAADVQCELGWNLCAEPRHEQRVDAKPAQELDDRRRQQPQGRAIRHPFRDIKSVMQEGDTCTSCHKPGAPQRPPVFFSNEDRDEDNIAGTATTTPGSTPKFAADQLTDIVASPLLRKPSDNHHGGSFVLGFAATAAPGDPARQKYDLFLTGS
jgi:hypothetical protein